MSGRTARALSAALAGGCLLLAGCASTEPVGVPPAPVDVADPGAPSGGTSVADPRENAAVLTAQRESLGIAPCTDIGEGQPVDALNHRGYLPDLEVPCLDGSGTVNLFAARDTPLVVNVWATWCGPCREEAPYLAAVSAAADGQVDFVGVDVEDPDAGAALDFAAGADWTYPQLADPDRAFFQQLGAAGVPQTLMVDEDGRVVYRHAGAFSSEAQLRSLVEEHLGADL